jgi:hypothetical protein
MAVSVFFCLPLCLQHRLQRVVRCNPGIYTEVMPTAYQPSFDCIRQHAVR